LAVVEIRNFIYLELKKFWIISISFQFQNSWMNLTTCCLFTSSFLTLAQQKVQIFLGGMMDSWWLKQECCWRRQGVSEKPSFAVKQTLKNVETLNFLHLYLSWCRLKDEEYILLQVSTSQFCSFFFPYFL